MGRMYSGVFKSQAVTAVGDLFELLAPSDAILVIHEWGLSQSTEVGDAAEEMLVLTTNRGVGAVTSSNGTTVTTQPIADGDPATGGTLERNATNQMAAGSGTLETDLEVHVWNIRVPYQRTYTPETRPIISPGNRWTLELETNPADSITMSGYIIFEEIGG